MPQKYRIMDRPCAQLIIPHELNIDVSMEISNDGQTRSDQRNAIKVLVWMTRHFYRRRV